MTSTGPPQARVTVELIHHLDAADWRDLHDGGLVPSSTPYGIGDLARFGFDVRFRPSPRGRVLAGVARRAREQTDAVEWAEALWSWRTRSSRSTDVVLCWDEFTGVPAAVLSAAPRRAPVVTGVHLLTDPLGRSRSFLRAATQGLQCARLVFVQSRSMIPALSERYGVAPDKLRFVPFGVDEQWFRASAAPVDPDLVVSVGDDRHRDHGTLIDAVRRVRRTRATRLELATLLPIELPDDLGHVHREHLGARRPAFYGGAAVVAVATSPNVHGSGLSVIVEAMSCGRPYVVTDSPGLHGYVEDGVTGFVVPPGDAGALADALACLLDDPARADAMGRLGRRAVEERFTSVEQARHLAAVLEEAVST